MLELTGRFLQPRDFPIKLKIFIFFTVVLLHNAHLVLSTKVCTP